MDTKQATEFSKGIADPKRFTGSGDEQWKLVLSVTSTLFFPTGKFVDSKAILENRR